MALGLHANDQQGVLRSVIERGVGPFKMSNSEFSAFIDDLKINASWADRARFGAFAALSLGDGKIASYGPNSVRDKFEMFERKTVTHFLIRTDFLQIEPSKSQVSFVGDNGCSSPFANLEIA